MRTAGLFAASAVLLIGAAAWAGSRSGEVVRVEHRLSEMVRVPAGPFWMGFPDTEAERENIKRACQSQLQTDRTDRLCEEELLFQNALGMRRVFLYEFEIDRYEVTVAQYRACVAAGKCDVAALQSGDTRYMIDELPMVNVTWHDAASYCRFRGKRLPTEAEWEKAARGTDGRRWPWGNHDRKDGANHGKLDYSPVARNELFWAASDEDGVSILAPPGSMPWADSPFGAYNLAGNVSEWVADYPSDSYADLPLIDPVRDTPTALSGRAYRGGSWLRPRFHGRTYFRPFGRWFWREEDGRYIDLGFRCARGVRR